MSKIVKAGPGLHVGTPVLAYTVDRDRIVSKDPKIVQGHKLKKIRVAGKDIAVGDGLDACACNNLPIDWLPFAAEHYQISKNINDYVLLELHSVCASIPNRNLDSMGYNELTSWRSLHGRACYGTFIGKPAHKNHENSDDTKALGCVFSATMVPFRGQWHVKILKGIDRTKAPRMARLVQQRLRVGHSMGCLVERTTCSLPWCQFGSSDGTTTCQHIQGGAGKGQIIRSHLVYENLNDFGYVEDSVVEDPANVMSLTDFVWEVNQ